MYARTIKQKNQRWNYLLQQSKYYFSSNFGDFSVGQCLSPLSSTNSLTRRYLSNTSSLFGLASRRKCTKLHWRSDVNLRNFPPRFYSSEGDGRNTSEDKHVDSKAVADCEKANIRTKNTADSAWHRDAHARLGKQDQLDWLKNEKLAMENKKKESPFLTRRERFRNEFLRRIVHWEKITVSWDTFPYYLHENTKNLLVECTASHLKHKKFTTDYGGRLTSSSGRILLQSIPGTELYRERLVRALARDLQVPLLVLDGNILASCDIGEDESESDGDNSECASESETEEENDASNEEDYTSSGEAKAEGSDDEVDINASVEDLRKLIPCNIEEFEKSVSGDTESSSTSSKAETEEPSEKANLPLKRGDRVKYIGPSVCIEANNRIVLGKIPTSDGAKNVYTVIRGRTLSSGQRGEVYEVNGDQVAVIFDISSKTEEVKDEKNAETATKPSICWLNAKDIEHDLDAQTHDFYVAMEVLCEILESQQPLVVYFPDSSLWFLRAVSKSNRKEFIDKVQEMFDRLSGPVVLICGQNKVESGSKEKEKFKYAFSSFHTQHEMISLFVTFAFGSQQTMILPNLGRLAKLLLNEVEYLTNLLGNFRFCDNLAYRGESEILLRLQEEDQLRIFNKQIEEDRRIVISRSNLSEIHKVLEEHDLSCMDLLHLNTDGVILTKEKSEKVVGWAKSHYLSSCLLPSVKGDRLQLPRGSLELAILRLKEQETASRKPSQKLKSLAKDEYETNFVSAVVPPGEIGVKFDDVGALEDVKKALNELVILPMRRPELFSHGNLLRPCKGILLFGPPGTGKTLLAKALATEAGANFISITGSTLTSKAKGSLLSFDMIHYRKAMLYDASSFVVWFLGKMLIMNWFMILKIRNNCIVVWFGDAEKLTRALFSFASKLAPVIIFVDEVDSLLGARGGSFEHEATRRMRNEFMAAWDGLRSKDSQRILILGATNRPFDLDDAVIRRLPRRIYVDLPDAQNRLKILKIILDRENLESGFPFDQLANATEGYSGSDLKNLCIAAAYRPVQELLEGESKDDTIDGVPILRPLKLDDFIHSKAKVGPSVAYDAASMNELRKWNDQYGEGGSRRKSPFGF
ncbi:P-loop containing nucleoside triphosphatehydrolases superfamily protein [Striga asiatica]|uniref:P-loop containing nucleoside triphosphatehydrolases superfamily protein n=1 Tax=Striga asiatica TaxID=4170 RepID=A0A5A7RI39_STRAF|nr:P-loop containing nucleoside triphosphatehydrolases superfamily protein [Striga asiatica]